MLIIAQKVMIFFLDSAACHRCAFSKWILFPQKKINLWKGHLFPAKVKQHSPNNWWVWRKRQMQFYSRKKRVTHDLIFFKVCCNKTARFSLENTWRLTIDYEFCSTHQVPWERTTPALNHAPQQHIHSHILDVIVQNTSAVSTTQLIPGPGIN